MTTHEHDYEVPPSELFATLSDEKYLLARHERFGGVGTPTSEKVDDSSRHHHRPAASDGQDPRCGEGPRR